MSNFADVIENIKKFDYEELQELNFLTSKYINDFERTKLLDSHIEAINEYDNGDLNFSSDINTLKEMLEL